MIWKATVKNVAEVDELVEFALSNGFFAFFNSQRETPRGRMGTQQQICHGIRNLTCSSVLFACGVLKQLVFRLEVQRRDGGCCYKAKRNMRA